jgi:hypothetical protein
MLDTATQSRNRNQVGNFAHLKTQADARLDRRARHLAAITPHVPVFVCRNLLILADRDAATAQDRVTLAPLVLPSR